MTREEARKAAEVMMAYADGKEIEYRKKGDSEWQRCNFPIYDWFSFGYRVKPQPKFDPKTLQPFDKVLAFVDGVWCCDFYSNPLGGEHLCVCWRAERAIPYNEETKHLVGTTDEVPEFYRYWEE